MATGKRKSSSGRKTSGRKTNSGRKKNDIQQESFTEEVILWVIVAIVAPCFQFVAGIAPLLFPGTGRAAQRHPSLQYMEILR